MTDERREAAEKHAKESLPELVKYQDEQDAGNYGMAAAWNADNVAAEKMESHLDGQESRQEEINELRRELRMKEIDCDELERLNRQGFRHCRDCCCARSWEALGGWSTKVGKDLPTCILDLRAENAKLREAVHDFLCECALAEDFHRSYDVWQITKGSMDELRRALEEKS